MNRTEAQIQHAILQKFGREPDVTLWRNNTGSLREEWVTTEHLQRALTLLGRGELDGLKKLLGALLNAPSRWVQYGLCVGSSDIIGIVANTQDGASGKPGGIFLALEVKRPGTGKLTIDQQYFLDLVNSRGGIGRCVRSEEDAEAAINEARAL